ncbi:MAG TPA: hypothetical protein VLZ75_10700 [Chitinophagales bacterium]|nr:hypothetical protein [Chitinophagales bacterium]
MKKKKLLVETSKLKRRFDKLSNHATHSLRSEEQISQLKVDSID